MATKIQLRRDTAANWALVNPILSEGEMGLETDTGKKKIGNGIAAWDALAYDVALPEQTGQTGKYLKTDGVSAAWDVVDSLPTQSPAASAQFLYTDGTSASWKPLQKIHYVDPLTTGIAITYTSDGDYADYAALVAALPSPVEGQWVRLQDQTTWRGSRATDDVIYWFPFGTRDMSLPPYVAYSNEEDAISPLYNVGVNEGEPLFIYLSKSNDTLHPIDVPTNHTITLLPNRSSEIPFIVMANGRTGNWPTLAEANFPDVNYSNLDDSSNGFISADIPRKEIVVKFYGSNGWYINQNEDFANSDNGRGLAWFIRTNAIEGKGSKDNYVTNTGLQSNVDGKFAVLSTIHASTLMGGLDLYGGVLISVDNGLENAALAPYGIYSFNGANAGSVLYLPGNATNQDQFPIGGVIQLVLGYSETNNALMVATTNSYNMYALDSVTGTPSGPMSSINILARATVVKFMRTEQGWLYLGPTTILD